MYLNKTDRHRNINDRTPPAYEARLVISGLLKKIRHNYLFFITYFACAF